MLSKQQPQGKFVRKENPSEKRQEKANQYDEFIRKVFRIFQLDKDTSEKIQLLKEKYSEICPDGVERNELFIERLKKVKDEIDTEKSNVAQHFLQAIKLLEHASIINSSTFNELVSEGLDAQELSLVNYAQKRKALANDKRFINSLLQQKMRPQDRLKKNEKVSEILRQFGKIDYSYLDPSKELKVEFENYGSNQNGLGLLSSDFDISLTTLKPVDERKLLDYFAKEIKPILNSLKEEFSIYKVTHEKTRIPIINLNLKKGDIYISFTVNNILAVYNSKLLRTYAEFDTRCHSLCLLVKIWARMHKIVSVQRGFLSSYALNLMVINFLQCMNNPILPSLQKESKKDEIIEVYRKINNDNLDLFQTNVKFETDPQIINTLKKQYSKNELTDIELLKEFFAFYSHHENFNNIKLSIKEGKHEPRDNKYKEEGFLYSIQDPFDIHHNPGYSLRKDSSQAQEFLDRMKKSHKLLEDGKFKEVFQFSTL